MITTAIFCTIQENVLVSIFGLLEFGVHVSQIIGDMV